MDDVKLIPDVFSQDVDNRGRRELLTESSVADLQRLPDCFGRNSNLNTGSTCRSSGSNSPTPGVATARSFTELTAREARKAAPPGQNVCL